ncbi:hypothetical protein XU06_18910 [Rhodococcus erythropolis]|nr:hypothetical protein XU06_18910 [Rhodococcus erythropolis]
MTPIPENNSKIDAYLSKSRDRWRPISKKVVYLDFRAELSAFDKFLYHSSYNRFAKNRTQKRYSLVKNSTGLAKSFNRQKLNKTESEKFTSYRRLNKNGLLSVSEILGKDFSRIEIVRHKFYSSDAYSAKLFTDGREYSEAHAGSGEFAVIRLVDEIHRAQNRSLILLDEPEVSLHPGAQRLLMIFLKKAALEKSLQIVLSTHSPTIIEQLPRDAIKLLGSTSQSTGVQLLSNETTPSQAFFHLGHSNGIGEARILVEDDLVAVIVEHAIRLNMKEMLEKIIPTPFPGGAGGILKQTLPVLALADSQNVTILLDGDQRKKEPDWNEISRIPTDGEHANEWTKQIGDYLGLVPTLFSNSSGSKKGGDPDSAARNINKIMHWSKDKLFYLHGEAPEVALLSEMEDVPQSTKSNEAKKIFKELAAGWHRKTEFEVTSAIEILQYQTHVIKNLDKSSPLIISAWAAIRPHI